jgi:hypothetical protein
MLSIKYISCFKEMLAVQTNKLTEEIQISALFET